jgi:hypothetical protein
MPLRREQRRRSLKVLSQVGCRIPHGTHLVVAWVSIGPPLTSCCVHIEVGAVEIGQRLLLRSILDEQETPPLAVGTGRRLERKLNALHEHVSRHRAIKVQPLTHGSGSTEDLIGRQVELHVCIVSDDTRARPRSAPSGVGPGWEARARHPEYAPPRNRQPIRTGLRPQHRAPRRWQPRRLP